MRAVRVHDDGGGGGGGRSDGAEVTVASEGTVITEQSDLTVISVITETTGTMGLSEVTSAAGATIASVMTEISRHKNSGQLPPRLNDSNWPNLTD